MPSKVAFHLIPNFQLLSWPLAFKIHYFALYFLLDYFIAGQFHWLGYLESSRLLNLPILLNFVCLHLSLFSFSFFLVLVVFEYFTFFKILHLHHFQSFFYFAFYFIYLKINLFANILN